MKKNLLIWSAVSAVVMLLLPGLTVAVVKSDAAMAVCFLLFFAVDPIYSVVTGAVAGRNIKEMWALPIISSALFLIGTWIFFDMAESAFVLYAGIYLVFGIAAMLISFAVTKKLRQ